MANKSKKILSEISAGELLDKISILEIKIKMVKSKSGLKEIKKEYKILRKIQKSSITMKNRVKNLFNSLKNVNLKLWRIEDKLRIYEKKKNFGKNFINLARQVYINNDRRSKLKSKLNELLGSNIREIKEYIKY